MSNPFTYDNPLTGQENIPQAVVEVDTIDPTDEGAKFLAPSDSAFIWTDYIIDNRYHEDRQTWMLPVASPFGFGGNKAGFCQLAAPTLLWVCDWTASSTNGVPEIPSATVSDPNWVLLSRSPETRNIMNTADGESVVYRVSATYVYGHKSPPSQPFDAVAFGRPPWLEDTYKRNVSATLLKTGLIDTPVGGGGGGGGLDPGGPVPI